MQCTALSRFIGFFHLPPLRRLLAIASIVAIAGCSSPEERAQSLYESGAEYLQAGDPTRAMLEFRNAVKLDEKLAPAWFAIAQIEERLRGLERNSDPFEPPFDSDISMDIAPLTRWRVSSFNGRRIDTTRGQLR